MNEDQESEMQSFEGKLVSLYFEGPFNTFC